MTKLNGILGAIAVCIAATSCTNDLDKGLGGQINGGQMRATISPDVVAWSGTQTLGNTFTGANHATTRSENVSGCSTDWNTIVSSWQKPKYLDTSDLTEEDITKIRELLSPEGQVSNNTTIPYKNYWIQHVFKGTATYNAYDKDGNEMQTNKLASDAMDKLSALDPNDNYIDIGNFNSGKNESSNNVGTVNGVVYNFTVVGTSLMYNMGVDNITPTNQFRFHSSFGDRWFDNYYIIKYKDCYYIGFDYEGHKDVNNPNEERDYNRDWKYDDWIVRIMPAYAIGENPDIETPECNCGDGEECTCNPNECDCPACKEKNDKCDTCGHPKHGTNNEKGSCDTCNENEQGGCYDSGEVVTPNCPGCNHPKSECGEECECGCNNPSNPGNGSNKYANNEVEINLSLNDVHKLPNGNKKYDIADLVSKLSIHVRYPHDVEVILPVPERLYCNQDDLYILKDHYKDVNGVDNWVYGGEEDVVSFPIQGTMLDGTEVNELVTLHVEFVPAGNGTQGYIKVWTEGINENVINYLRETYGDGINFEVYNYYNRGNQYSLGSYEEIDYFTLQYNYLSHSSVKFDQVCPDFYINAFNTVDGQPNWGDCYVWISGDDRALGWTVDQTGYFFDPYQGAHFNGSDLNWIYTNRSVTGAVNPTDNVMPTETFPFTIETYQDFLVKGEVVNAPH